MSGIKRLERQGAEKEDSFGKGENEISGFIPTKLSRIGRLMCTGATPVGKIITVEK